MAVRSGLWCHLPGATRGGKGEEPSLDEPRDEADVLGGESQNAPSSTQRLDVRFRRMAPSSAMVKTSTFTLAGSVGP